MVSSMTMYRWTELTKDALTAVTKTESIAVLPLGATEQHGPHLPLGTDTALVEAVLDRSALKLRSDLDVLILPSQAIALSPEHASFPGTLTLSSETVLRVWQEIGASVANAGFQKLVLFNGHGGNVAAMDIVARDLRANHGLWVAHTSWFALADQAAYLSTEELKHGIHGGLAETSAMLAISPQLVDMRYAQNFRSRGQDWETSYHRVGIGGKQAKLGWMMSDLNEQGAAGNAAAATAELGNLLLESAAEGFAAFLDEFHRMATPMT